MSLILAAPPILEQKSKNEAISIILSGPSITKTQHNTTEYCNFYFVSFFLHNKIVEGRRNLEKARKFEKEIKNNKLKVRERRNFVGHVSFSEH